MGELLNTIQFEKEDLGNKALLYFSSNGVLCSIAKVITDRLPVASYLQGAKYSHYSVCQFSNTPSLQGSYTIWSPDVYSKAHPYSAVRFLRDKMMYTATTSTRTFASDVYECGGGNVKLQEAYGRYGNETLQVVWTDPLVGAKELYASHCKDFVSFTKAQLLRMYELQIMYSAYNVEQNRLFNKNEVETLARILLYDRDKLRPNMITNLNSHEPGVNRLLKDTLPLCFPRNGTFTLKPIEWITDNYLVEFPLWMMQYTTFQLIPPETITVIQRELLRILINPSKDELELELDEAVLQYFPVRAVSAKLEKKAKRNLLRRLMFWIKDKD
jgi:hypothetical protein